MGLRDELQADIAEAFDTDLADAITSFVLRKTISTFDEGTNIATTVDTDVISRGSFLTYRVRDLRDTAVQPTDRKLIVLQNELSVEPEVNDFIIANSITYDIKDVRKDPISATWTIRCRK